LFCNTFNLYTLSHIVSTISDRIFGIGYTISNNLSISLQSIDDDKYRIYTSQRCCIYLYLWGQCSSTYSYDVDSHCCVLDKWVSSVNILLYNSSPANNSTVFSELRSLTTSLLQLLIRISNICSPTCFTF
jgi:hypothetical protein